MQKATPETKIPAWLLCRRCKCWSYIDTLVSGSPIIQNGMIVGAVTHVFVNDPTQGYAIFAERMLETTRKFEQSEKQKDAS